MFIRLKCPFCSDGIKEDYDVIEHEDGTRETILEQIECKVCDGFGYEIIKENI